MSRAACCLALVVFFCVMLVDLASAGAVQTAKVYREYPGYITIPTCENPRMPGQSVPVGETTMPRWNSPYSWTFTPMLGYQVFDGGLDIDDNVSLGMAIGYNITSNWALEADVRYTPTHYTYGKNEDVNVWTVGGGVLYHFLPEQRLNPYLEAGLGGIVYDINNTSHDDEDYMGYWGGGLKYAINRTMSFRVDVRDIIDYRSGNDFNGQEGPNWRHSLSAMAGLSFQLGR